MEGAGISLTKGKKSTQSSKLALRSASFPLFFRKFSFHVTKLWGVMNSILFVYPKPTRPRKNENCWSNLCFYYWAAEARRGKASNSKWISQPVERIWINELFSFSSLPPLNCNVKDIKFPNWSRAEPSERASDSSTNERTTMERLDGGMSKSNEADGWDRY